MRFLLSTFTHLLDISVSMGRGNKRETKLDIVDGGLGVYFGLTRNIDTIYSVSRNKDLYGRRQQKDRPQNAIIEIKLNSADLEISRRWTLPEFDDLHQIRVFGDFLAVLTGHSPELLFVNRSTREIAAKISLSDLVPDFLRHDAPEDRPSDTYHFNSLTFYKDRVFVLAHNWEYGSFILQAKIEFSAEVPIRLYLERVFQNMGVGSHDVVLVDGHFFVCDGVNSNLLILDARTNNITTININPIQGIEYYPRGLSLDNNYIIVGSGIKSNRRVNRESTSTQISVFNRKKEFITNMEIGSFGNTCDILFLDRKDLSDQ